MTYKLKILNQSFEQQYIDFIKGNDKFLWYCSLDYKRLLEDYLKAKSIYFLVFSGNSIKACLPLMQSKDAELGFVINLLPFYGSNGSFLLNYDLDDSEKWKLMELLYKELLSYSEKNKIAAFTLITNPLDPSSKNYLEVQDGINNSDFRMGQITPLPNSSEELIKLFKNPRPRNIRKAIKANVKVRKSNDKKDFDFLSSTHRDNITYIGGKPKSDLFFQMVRENIPEKNYSLFIAEIDGIRISALLVFYFNSTIEYFTPCTLNNYRNYQASALLIFEAMKYAIDKNFKNWNWGGTWESQKGVYDFKKKWGSIDLNYYYFTKVYNPEILNQTSDKLLELYPNFYITSFSNLKNK